MDKRRLGRTGLAVTAVALGGAPIAKEVCNDTEALETIWAALEQGVNLIDTSPFYGAGRSERLIGRALAERPDLAAGCLLSTKTGRYRDFRDYTYDGTLRSVAQSLERLQVDHLSIVHLHDIVEAEHLREILRTQAAHAALRRLQGEGVVDWIGLGTRDLGTLQLAVESGEFDLFMIANQYHLLERAGAAVIASAAMHDVGVLIAGAYATGILAKGNVDEATFRYRAPSPEIRARTAALEELCRRWGCSLAAAAVQFCLRGPAAQAIAVLGARTREQALQSVATVREPIPPGFWTELEQLGGQAG